MLFGLRGSLGHVIFDPDNKVYTLHIESDGHGNVDKPLISNFGYSLSLRIALHPEAQLW